MDWHTLLNSPNTCGWFPVPPNVHQYTGKRLKLKTPITYETKDGVTVVKKYKNELRKVKKSDKKESN